MSPISVRLVAPTTDHRLETLAAIAEDLRLLARPEATLSHVQVEGGPLCVRTDEDERRAVPGVLRRVTEAERDGIQAVVIDCTSDVGLVQARALAPLPIVGAGEVLRARLIGRRAVWLSATDLEHDPLTVARAGLARGAEVVAVGSTGWSPVAAELRRRLHDHGHDVEVLDPLPLAVAEAVRRVRITLPGE